MLNRENNIKKRNTIKRMMIITLMPISIITCIILAVSAMYFSQRAMINTGKKLLVETSRIGGEEVYNVLSQKLIGIESIASIPEIIDENVSLEEKFKILKANSEVQKNNNMGIVYKDGMITYLDGSVVDINDRDFFIEAMKGKAYISKPFISRIDGKLIVALSAPIMSNNEIIGAIVTLRNGDDFSNITNEIKLLDTGEAFLIDSDGTYIANKDNEKVNGNYNVIKASNNEDESKLAKIFSNMIKGENSVEEWDRSTGKAFIGYAPIGDLGWSIGVIVSRSELLSELGVMNLSQIVAGGIAVIIMIIVILKVSAKISKPIKSVNSIIGEIESGDFTKEVDKVYLKDTTEIGEMSNALNNTVNAINSMMKGIKDNSGKIDNQATGLAAISEEMSALTSNIVTAIGEVAKGTSSQAGDLVEISSDLDEFGNDINEVNNNIVTINNLTMEIGEKSSNSNEELRDLLDVIKDLNNNFNAFSASLEKMNNDIKQVNAMTDLINDISEQTNLLSLNAAIEAARAGESGKGFAVVADEIRKLAEMSKDSSNNINTIVQNILKNTSSIVENTSLISEDINKQNQVVDGTIKAFNEISEGIKVTTPKVAQTVNIFKEINNKKENILNKIENISAISEEISATAEEISASSQELNSAGEEVATSAQNLTVSTNYMDNELQKFKIK